VGGFLLAFAGGMLSFLSPCVLPLVPGYLSLMSGVSVTQLAEGSTTVVDLRRLLRSTLLFVAGFTLVFVLLGAGASAVGQTLLRHKIILTQLSGALVIVMGLFLAGLVVPGAMQRERRFHVLPSRLGVFAPPLMGMAFAFGWTPCIGPILATVLALAANEGSLATGVKLLFVYSLGLGIPFILAAVAIGPFLGFMQRFRRHLGKLEKAMGALLVITGLLFFTGSINWFGSWLLDNFPALSRIEQAVTPKDLGAEIMQRAAPQR